MANIARIRVTWTGLTGLPGLSTFYSNDTSTPDVSALTTFINAIKGSFPSGLNWDIPNSGDVIADTSGTLQGDWSGTGGGSVTSTGAFASYPAGTGCRVVWNTGAVVNGRRLKGATFLAPLVTGAYQDNGTIGEATRTTFATAANVLAATGLYVIWHRPFPGTTNGSSANITSAVIPDVVSSLRSRRT